MMGANAVSETFRVLAEPRRRTILRHFVSEGKATASYEELVEALLSADGGPDSRQRATIKLHHVDLPALEEAQLVEHDDRSETIRYVENSLVEEVLDDGRDRTRLR